MKSCGFNLVKNIDGIIHSIDVVDIVPDNYSGAAENP